MRILLIDDDRDDQVLFAEAMALVEPEISCDIAENGVEGLVFLDKAEKLPDIVFLDLNLPMVDGREVLRVIRTTPNFNSLRVVIYSTSISEAEKIWFRTMQASCMVKPNNFDTLVQLLKKKLAEIQFQIAC